MLEELVKLDGKRDVVYVELNDSHPDYTKLNTPEFERDLPLHWGVSDTPGLLAALMHIGYDGPVVCEPFNRRFHHMSSEEAVTEAKAALDEVWAQAESYPLDPDLIGTHQYYPDPAEAFVQAGGLHDHSLSKD